MSHYAKVVETSVNREKPIRIVEQVIVASGEFIKKLPKVKNVEWIKTSYNTRNGQWIDPITNQPSNHKKPLRGNFAGIGFVYNTEKDIFESLESPTDYKLIPTPEFAPEFEPEPESILDALKSEEIQKNTCKCK